MNFKTLTSVGTDSTITTNGGFYVRPLVLVLSYLRQIPNVQLEQIML